MILCFFKLTEVIHADAMKPIIRNEANVIVPEIVMVVKMSLKNIEGRKTVRKDAVVDRKSVDAEVGQKSADVEAVPRTGVAVNLRNAGNYQLED